MGANQFDNIPGARISPAKIESQDKTQPQQHTTNSERIRAPKMKCFFILLGLVPLISCLPMTTDQALVITTTVIQDDEADIQNDKPGDDIRAPTITNFHVHANVTNRFATTVVTSKVKNEAGIAQEATFFVIIPEQAFISGFIMNIGDKNYTAYVQEKEKAKATYDDAVLSGMGAAHVAVNARDSNKFTVSTNIEPASKATFYLTYEELLQRKDGQYELVVNIHPNQIVKDMQVQVDISESRMITKLATPAIRSGNEIAKEKPALQPKADLQQPTKNMAHVRFAPDFEQQKQIAQGLERDEETGIGGQFVVQYDVQRDPTGGEVLVKDGYFVHFFAPDDQEPLEKHVVFVLDTSGSMYGQKMEQLKTAMHNILGDLKPKDFFNLVEFNTNVKVWNLDAPQESTNFPDRDWYHHDTTFELTDVSFPPAYPVNAKKLEKAKTAVDKMVATGGTNIYEALRVGLHLVKQRQMRTRDSNVQPLILFLTDGDPTVGKTSTKDIITGISEQNLQKVPIISLSFGTGADRNFLEKISLSNSGFARHIYEDSDASLQLENFYKEISSPKLKNVKFVYTPDVTSLLRDEVPVFYGGAEIVVCGTYSGNEFAQQGSKVMSWGRNGPVDLKPTVQKATGQLERLWAYLSVKKFLKAKEVAQGETKEYEDKALKLALKYSFVTPLTSLVVVKPNATKAVEPLAADTNDNNHAHFAATSFAGRRPQSKYRLKSTSHRMRASGQYGIALASGLSSFGAPGQVHQMMFSRPGPLPNRVALSSPIAPQAFVPQAALGGNVMYSVKASPSRFDADVDADSVPLLSTPELEYASTTVTSTTPEPVKINLPAKIEAGIPWLKEQLNSDGTLKFLQGSYQLGLNQTSPTDEECTDPTSEEGLCKLMQDCEDVYDKLTSPKTFKDYFCVIDNEFVGVCCRKKQPAQQ